MEIVQITAIGVVSAVLAITLKKQSPEFALLISLAAGTVIFFMLLPLLSETVETLNHLNTKISAGSGYVGIVIKIIGIAYVSEFGAQVCHDAGEIAIASKIELAGKMLIITASIPVITGLIDMILGVL